MSDNVQWTVPTIPLSDLRKLWRNVKARGYYASDQEIFRSYVRQEVMRRTIASLRAELAETLARMREAKE